MNPFVASPSTCPARELDDALAFCRDLGLSRFEVFSDWAKSHFDFSISAEAYRARCEAQGLTITSFHLPVLKAGEPLNEVIRYAEAAKTMGAGVVIFRADSLETYQSRLPEFLDVAAPLGLATVLSHHTGTPIETPAHMKTILDTVDDPRLHCLLEIGHLAKKGFYWREAYDDMRGRLDLVHLKEMKGTGSAPYGEGDIDFVDIFRTLAADGYRGYYVIEMEYGNAREREPHVKPGVNYLLEQWRKFEAADEA
ncbi:MAG: sugar phosphate isomerase/epimerase family protein [Opitutales bacterium]